MQKDRNELDEIVENMKEMLGTENLLDELISAMDTKEIQENLEYINRMHDLSLF